LPGEEGRVGVAETEFDGNDEKRRRGEESFRKRNSEADRKFGDEGCRNGEERQRTGGNFINLFTAVIYECL